MPTPGVNQPGIANNAGEESEFTCNESIGKIALPVKGNHHFFLDKMNFALFARRATLATLLSPISAQ
jgi:hypothetical protein